MHAVFCDLHVLVPIAHGRQAQQGERVGYTEPRRSRGRTSGTRPPPRHPPRRDDAKHAQRRTSSNRNDAPPANPPGSPRPRSETTRWPPEVGQPAGSRSPTAPGPAAGVPTPPDRGSPAPTATAPLPTAPSRPPRTRTSVGSAPGPRSWRARSTPTRRPDRDALPSRRRRAPGSTRASGRTTPGPRTGLDRSAGPCRRWRAWSNDRDAGCRPR